MSTADAYAKLDKNGDGQVKGSEVTSLLAASKDVGGKWQELFPSLLDGVVTKEEFEKVCEAIPGLAAAILAA